MKTVDSDIKKFIQNWELYFELNTLSFLVLGNRNEVHICTHVDN